MRYTHSDSNARLRAIIETAIDGIITIDSRGIIESANPAAAKLFGYTIGELIGQPVTMLMPEPYRSEHGGYMRRYQAGAPPKIIGIGREVPGVRKNGELFPFRLAVSEIELEDGSKLYTGMIHDLTEQKATEEQLRRYASELERSNRDLEDFAYISSHDLQEPLRKIQAFGSRIQAKEAHLLSEQGRDYLERMLNAAGRLQTLINDLLTFSRVSTKAQPFMSISLSNVLNEVIDDLEVAIEQAGARIHRHELTEIEADPTQIRQLFQNLLSNALKFRRSDEQMTIRVTGELIQEKGEATPMIRISFEDNGIGFEQKYADRIFNIFQRLEGQRFQGSGVGLAICKRIVTRHGGRIEAHSERGSGSKFVVILPLRQKAGNTGPV